MFDVLTLVLPWFNLEVCSEMACAMLPFSSEIVCFYYFLSRCPFAYCAKSEEKDQKRTQSDFPVAISKCRSNALICPYNCASCSTLNFAGYSMEQLEQSCVHSSPSTAGSVFVNKSVSFAVFNPPSWVLLGLNAPVKGLGRRLKSPLKPAISLSVFYFRRLKRVSVKCGLFRRHRQLLLANAS
jgi:hypothetical protein